MIPSPIACSSLWYFLILLLAAHQVNGRFHAASHSAYNFQAMDVMGMLPVSVFQLHVDPTIFAAEIYIFIFACVYHQLCDQISWCSWLTSPIHTHKFLYYQEKARAPFTTSSSASHPYLKMGSLMLKKLCMWPWDTPQNPAAVYYLQFCNTRCKQLVASLFSSWFLSKQIISCTSVASVQGLQWKSHRCLWDPASSSWSECPDLLWAEVQLPFPWAMYTHCNSMSWIPLLCWNLVSGIANWTSNYMTGILNIPCWVFMTEKSSKREEELH